MYFSLIESQVENYGRYGFTNDVLCPQKGEQ